MATVRRAAVGLRATARRAAVLLRAATVRRAVVVTVLPREADTARRRAGASVPRRAGSVRRAVRRGMMMMGGQPKFSPLAIISMITGILSIPTCFCSCFAPGLNSPLAIAGLVCGILAMNKIRAEPKMWRGTGMAIAGIVTGALGMLLVLLAAFTTLDESIRAGSGL